MSSVPAAKALRPGDHVDDYVIDDVLAVGGFGTVYRAHHRSLGRHVALKVLHPELASYGEVLVRFEREARAVNLFDHPNVVDIFDIGALADGRPYFVMEYLDGEDLELLLRSRGALGPAEVLQILEPLCDALEAAHAHGIIHRDLKASNVVLDERHGVRRVVLLDFGVAKLLDLDGSEATTVRQVLGSPCSIAPEQILGEPVDRRTDVYALGVLTFQLLSGEVPYPAESMEVAQYKHLRAPRPRVSRRADLSADFDEVIMRAMAIDPAGRQPSAAAFISELRFVVERQETRTDLERPRLSPCLGCLVETRVDVRALARADISLLTDLEEVQSLAAERLRAAGFFPALATASAVLYVLPVGAALDQRRDGIDAVVALEAALAERPTADDRIELRLIVHAADALVLGDRLRGGELADVSAWTAPAELAGMLCSSAAIDGLALALTRVGNGSWFRHSVAG
ncbi:MAG TPA: serine/threonine-protein kinase [Kofleriaceae bacterium]|nr:serine/threonine-protein kinase [Kofleriaceae bacterium]